MSADQQTIFNTNTGDTPPQNMDTPAGVQNAPVNNPFADLLGGIKNERGEPKYKDTAEALNALKHAQDYIPQLKNEKLQMEQELSTLRAQVEKLKAVEATVERLAANQNNSGNTNQPVFDEQKIAELVTNTLTRREVEALQKANVSSVVNSLQAKFGQEAEKTFYTKAQELGMSAAQMNQLAASSPQAVLQLFGVQGSSVQKVNVPAPVQAGVNTAGFQPKQDSFISKNSKGALIGATSEDMLQERQNAVRMVEELDAAGMSIDDLANPKNYFKYFK